MNNLKFITDYKDIAEFRQSFNELANKTFGIDFERWYQLGFWGDTYICHSFIDGNRVISNVSVNLLDIILNGEKKKAVHIGTVMTDPQYRNRGLAGELMKIVLDKYEGNCDIIYLSPNDRSLGFYLKLGFKPIKDSLFILDVNLNKLRKSPIRKLDIFKEKDSEIIRRLAAERKPISRAFSVLNGQHILTWYCVNAFRRDIYYIEAEDIIVLYKYEGKELHVYDVISKDKVNFMHILESLASETTEKVVFYFTPEFEDMDTSKISLKQDETYCIRPEAISLPENFKYPITSLA